MVKAKKTATKTTKTKKTTKKPQSVAKRIVRKDTLSREEFFKIRFTDQTLYWLIFGTASILFALWVYTLDSRVRDLYDQIDKNTNSTALYSESTSAP